MAIRSFVFFMQSVTPRVTVTAFSKARLRALAKMRAVAALKDDIENLNDFLIIEDAGGADAHLPRRTAPALRTDFMKPTMSASLDCHDVPAGMKWVE